MLYHATANARYSNLPAAQCTISNPRYPLIADLEALLAAAWEPIRLPEGALLDAAQGQLRLGSAARPAASEWSV